MSSQNELITKLNSLGCITFSGPQAQEYLQGQVTVDVTKMDEHNARFGAHCDFKGKTWSVFTALLNDGVFQLIMHQSALEKSLAEFKKYGVFSKVDIEEANGKFSFYGISGSQTLASLESMFTNLSEEHLSVVSNQYGSAICLNLSSARYLCVLNADGDAMLNELTTPEKFSDESAWEALDIIDAIPHVTAETSNEFVPQMLNLQAIAGIDFDKGCYMGQETVARTKFLGKNKRAAYILRKQGDETSIAIQPGTPLEKQAGENWRSGGTVLQSAVNNDATLLLGVLSNDTQTGDVLRLKEFPELQFEVSALPYKLD
jgi:folate-binding protein YgfZ